MKQSRWFAVVIGLALLSACHSTSSHDYMVESDVIRNYVAGGGPMKGSAADTQKFWASHEDLIDKFGNPDIGYCRHDAHYPPGNVDPRQCSPEYRLAEAICMSAHLAALDKDARDAQKHAVSARKKYGPIDMMGLPTNYEQRQRYLADKKQGLIQ